MTRHNLYLACKEALKNCVKHASATEVQICIDTTPSGFSLDIKDNGRGFEMDAPRNYVRRIYEKLRVRSRSQAVAKYFNQSETQKRSFFKIEN